MNTLVPKTDILFRCIPGQMYNTGYTLAFGQLEALKKLSCHNRVFTNKITKTAGWAGGTHQFNDLNKGLEGSISVLQPLFSVLGRG